MSVAEKRSCIDSAHPGLSIMRQCELIDLPRASYYRHASEGETPENLEMMRLIDEEYTRHPFYGSRKMRSYLRRLGYPVNRKRIRRLMHKMGLASVAPKPSTSKPAPGHKIYPYLLRDLDINTVNQVWCSDFTYIRLPGGFVYLTAVMDWHILLVLERVGALRSAADVKHLVVEPGVADALEGLADRGVVVAEYLVVPRVG